jgi:hypothetical protein
LIVDGSVPPSATSEHRPSWGSDLIDPYTAVTHYSSTSDDHNINTPASFSDSLSQDFQDPPPFEMEQTPVFTRPVETQKTSSSNGETQKESVNGQPELLASLLQNFHLSNAEKLGQSQSTKTNSERHRNGLHGKDAAHSKGSTSGDKTTGSQQGNEARQQTSSKRKPNGIDTSEKANGVNHNHKPKQKGRHDTSHNASAQGEAKNRNADHPPRKSGGATNGTNDANHSGWQTTKKKNRRNGKSSADHNGINGPEPLPADEALRKGG